MTADRDDDLSKTLDRIKQRPTVTQIENEVGFIIETVGAEVTGTPLFNSFVKLYEMRRKIYSTEKRYKISAEAEHYQVETEDEVAPEDYYVSQITDSLKFAEAMTNFVIRLKSQGTDPQLAYDFSRMLAPAWLISPDQSGKTTLSLIKSWHTNWISDIKDLQKTKRLVEARELANQPRMSIDQYIETARHFTEQANIKDKYYKYGYMNIKQILGHAFVWGNMPQTEHRYKSKSDTKSIERLTFEYFNDFVNQTMDAIIDTDDPRHNFARDIIMLLEEGMDDYGTIMHGAAMIREMRDPQDFTLPSWLKELYRLSNEEGDDWYRKMADNIRASIDADLNFYFLKADDLNETFSKISETNKESDLSLLHKQIKIIPPFPEPILSLAVWKENYPDLDIPSTAALIRYDSENNLLYCTVKVLNNIKMFTYIVNVEDFDILLDVIDEDNIPPDLKHNLRILTHTHLNRKTDKETFSKAVQGSQIQSKTEIDFTVRKKGPKQQEGSGNKRKHTRNQQFSYDGTQISSRLVVEAKERKTRPTIVNLSNHINDIPSIKKRVESALKTYRRGGGHIKWLVDRYGPSGGRILEVRIGKEYRLLAEINGNKASVFGIIPRKELDEFLESYR